MPHSPLLDPVYVTKSGWDFLRAAIREAGYSSVSDFAEALQAGGARTVTRFVIGNLSRGKRAFPQQYLDIIAKTLKMEPDRLLMGISTITHLDTPPGEAARAALRLNNDNLPFLQSMVELLGPLSLHELPALLEMYESRRHQTQEA